MDRDRTTPSAPTTPRRRRRRGSIIALCVAATACVIGAGAFVLPALLHGDQAGADAALGTENAVEAGKQRAAELAGGDEAITERQTVDGPGLFTYHPADDAVGDDGAVSNLVMVGLADKASFETITELADDLDATVVGVNDYLRLYQLHLPDGADIDAAVASADDAAGVETAQPELMMPVESAAIVAADVSDPGNDPAAQFADASSSPQLQPGAWGMQAIGAPVVWDYAARTDADFGAVGVFDNFRAGVSHDDLSHVRTSFDEATSELDPKSHGLHVTGIVTADGGAQGVAPGAPTTLRTWPTELHKKLFGDKAEQSITITDLAAGLTFLAEDDARVVNVSQGGPQDAEANGAALVAPLRALVEKYDLLVVAAAGNSACTQPLLDADKCHEEVNEPDPLSAESGPFWQARAQSGGDLDDNVVIVGNAAQADEEFVKAVNGTNGIEEYGTSQRGADVLAPGTDVLSTADPEDCNSDGSPWCADGYAFMTGTSMSSPHVVGIASALWAVDPSLTAAEVRSIIVGTANRSFAAEVVTEGILKSDPDDVPLVDAAAAMQIATELKEDTDLSVDEALEPALSPQLHGAWCPADQDGTDAEDCLDIGAYLDAHPDAELSPADGDAYGSGSDESLSPVDSSGRSSLEAEATLCLDGPCDEAETTITLRYSPPGAVWHCALENATADFCDDAGGEDVAAHPAGWPTLSQTTVVGGSRTESAPLRLNLFADGDYSELPDSLVPEKTNPLDGTWCSAPDAGAPETCVSLDTTTDPPTADLGGSFGPDLLVVAPLENGRLALTGGDCDAEAPDSGGSPCYPLGEFVPQGTPIDLPDYYQGKDYPERDRIWNSQSGGVMLRE